MNYTLSSDSPFNTTLSAHGRPAYRFETYAPPAVPRLTTLVLALDTTNTAQTVQRSSQLPPPSFSSIPMSPASRRSHTLPHAPAYGHAPAPSLYSSAPSALSEPGTISPSTFSLPSLISRGNGREERARHGARPQTAQAPATGEVQPYAYENHARAPSAREIARDEKRRQHAQPEPFRPPVPPFPPDVKRRSGQPPPTPTQQGQNEEEEPHGAAGVHAPRHAFSSGNLHLQPQRASDRPDAARRLTMIEDRDGSSVHSSHRGSRREGDRSRAREEGRGVRAAEVARVAWLAPGRVLVLVGDRTIGVHKRLWGSSRTFTAANGVSYKWTFNDEGATLTTNDGKRAPAATYTAVRGNGMAARLQLTPHGTSIREDIFATLVCVLGERRAASGASP